MVAKNQLIINQKLAKANPIVTGRAMLIAKAKKSKQKTPNLLNFKNRFDLWCLNNLFFTAYSFLKLSFLRFWHVGFLLFLPH